LVRTIPAADLATSVAVDTAIPICAWRNAGASLAPSPPKHGCWGATEQLWNAFQYLLSAIGRVVLIIFADFQFLLASGKTTR
jgi:hypothetical protein